MRFSVLGKAVPVARNFSPGINLIRRVVVMRSGSRICRRTPPIEILSGATKAVIERDVNREPATLGAPQAGSLLRVATISTSGLSARCCATKLWLRAALRIIVPPAPVKSAQIISKASDRFTEKIADATSTVSTFHGQLNIPVRPAPTQIASPTTKSLRSTSLRVELDSGSRRICSHPFRELCEGQLKL